MKSKNNNILLNENQLLKNDLNIYKNENEKLKNQINKLKNDNDRLNQELIKAQKIISNFNNKTQNSQKENTNIIFSLNEIIKNKDKEINDLKIKLENNAKNIKSVNYDDILVINFISLDQKINCGIKCLKTDTFAEVEEQLYQQYEEYRETNNNFIVKGKLVLRFKKICENNIKNGDKIQLINIE